MPKISVVVPVYNTAKYLNKCLDSLTAQTLSDIEIICVNDCSTDDSLKILKEYEAKDARIKLIDFAENKGVSVARNRGIDAATGDYLGFVDADDSVAPDFYAKLYHKAIETGAPVVKGNVYYVGDDYKTPELSDFYNQNERIKTNKAYFLYGFTSAIYKTETVKKSKIYFPEGITHFEDPYFSIKASIVFERVEFVDDAKYLYLKHSDSACENVKTPRKATDFAKAINMIADVVNAYNVPKQDYLIYYTFLMRQLVPWCHDAELDNETTDKMVEALSHLIDQAGDNKEAVLKSYFMYKKGLTIQHSAKGKEMLFADLRKKVRGSLQ